MRKKVQSKQQRKGMLRTLQDKGYGWFAGKCLITGPDTLRLCKQENRNGGEFLSVDLCSLRSYS